MKNLIYVIILNSDGYYYIAQKKILPEIGEVFIIDNTLSHNGFEDSLDALMFMETLTNLDIVLTANPLDPTVINRTNEKLERMCAGEENLVDRLKTRMDKLYIERTTGPIHLTNGVHSDQVMALFETVAEELQNIHDYLRIMRRKK